MEPRGACTEGRRPPADVFFWEQGDKPPRAEVLPQLAEALDVRAEALLSDNGVVAINKKGGATGKLKTIFEDASGLPRRQQSFINQYKQRRAR